MGAVTIHLPADIEEQVRRASAEAGVSVSAWVAEAARRQLDQRLPPPELTKWFGAFPELELPTRKERWSKDEP
ncbi:MAG: ribbon-helix-helix protein, CopG family [Hyphomonadaceae bacterium]|nr:ribbon-helix-helix protein, CopG family [Hyphomonadaceae bacterium]